MGHLVIPSREVLSSLEEEVTCPWQVNEVGGWAGWWGWLRSVVRGRRLSYGAVNFTDGSQVDEDVERVEFQIFEESGAGRSGHDEAGGLLRAYGF